MSVMACDGDVSRQVHEPSASILKPSTCAIAVNSTSSLLTPMPTWPWKMGGAQCSRRDTTQMISILDVQPMPEPGRTLDANAPMALRFLAPFFQTPSMMRLHRWSLQVHALSRATSTTSATGSPSWPPQILGMFHVLVTLPAHDIARSPCAHRMKPSFHPKTEDKRFDSIKALRGIGCLSALINVNAKFFCDCGVSESWFRNRYFEIAISKCACRNPAGASQWCLAGKFSNYQTPGAAYGPTT